MSFVSSTPSMDPTLALLRQQGLGGAGGASGTTATDATTGSGTIAGTRDAPDPAKATALSAMMGSISALMPKMSGEQLDALVTSFTSKMKDAMDKSAKGEIKTDQQQQKHQIEEKEKKYKEAAQKIAEAKYAASHASVFDKIKLAFQYIGAILAIVAGIAAIAIGCLTAETGVGLALGIAGGLCLITSGLLMLTMAADQTVSMATAKDGQPGMGMFARAIKAIAVDTGSSEADADKMATKGAMGISISLMILACVTGIVGGILAPEAEVSEVSEVASDLSELAQVGQDAADAADTGLELEQGVQNTATTSEQAASGIKTVMEVTDQGQTFVSTAANAATEVGSAVYNKQASDDSAASKDMTADAKRLEAMGKVVDDMIDMALGRLKSQGDRFNAMLDSMTDAMKDKADTMSRAQFRA